MNKTSTLPVLQNDRAQILDVLRGFALLGVLLDNLFGFTGYSFHTMAMREALPTFIPDMILGLSELTFVNGKFYSIFSLLFGIGFSIQMSRNKGDATASGTRLFYRRLLILLCIGLVHLIYVWEGDILVLYAITGFTLPLFRKLSDKTLLILATSLILSPVLVDLLKVIFDFKTGAFLDEMARAMDKKTGVPTDETFSVYLSKEGSGWQEWRNWQASGYLYRYSYIIESNRIPKVLGMFLFGLYAGRKMIYANLEQYAGMFKKLRLWGFLVGIPASLALTYFELDEHAIPKAFGLTDTIFYALGVVPLSLAYVAVICLFRIRTNGDNFLTVLAPMGRMALTNYLMQTVFGIAVYYGVGLGLGGDIGPTLFIPLGLALFAFQVFYSNLWFRYFNYGPMEWIWRQLTYGKILPLRKSK